MNVLSLFDGCACGRVSLERAAIKVENYFASEIDKYAIKIAQKNFSDIIQLGDIQEWKTWNLPKIDLIIGGSPCQGFSLAGKGLNFSDSRSKLFFTFVDIVKTYQPKYWLLENVRMKKEWQQAITDILEVEPVLINSALVSAQSRKRLYWANFLITQPEDKYIYLNDILEDDGVVDREKSYCVDANYNKGGNPKQYYTKSRRQLDKLPKKSNAVVSSFTQRLNGLYLVGRARDIKGIDIVRRVYDDRGKSPTLSSMQGGQRQPKVAIDDIHYRKLTVLECERLQTMSDGYTDGVSNTQRYKMIGNGWTIDVISHIFYDMKKQLEME